MGHANRFSPTASIDSKAAGTISMADVLRDPQASINSLWNYTGHSHDVAGRRHVGESFKAALAFCLPELDTREKSVLADASFNVEFSTSGMTNGNKRCHSRDNAGRVVDYNDSITLSISDPSRYSATLGSDIATRIATFRKLAEALGEQVTASPRGFDVKPEHTDKTMRITIPIHALAELFAKHPITAREAAALEIGAHGSGR